MNELFFLVVDCVKDCGGADILRIFKFIFVILDLVFFIVPIGLIIMLMVDFSKSVIANKEDEMKKNLDIVVKRLIFCVVLFLVPTIVEFAIGLVSDVGVKFATCIEIAKKEDDLEKCAVDYETFEPVYPNDVYYDELDSTYECYVCNFSNGRPSIYVWDLEKPVSNYGGCTSSFKIDGTRTTEDMCKNLEKKCWKCNDGSGYVLSEFRPSSGYAYKPANSYGYSSSACGAGFNSNPVRSCNCTINGCNNE